MLMAIFLGLIFGGVVAFVRYCFKENDKINEMYLKEQEHNK